MVAGVEVWQSGGITLAAFAARRLGIWSEPIPNSAEARPHTPAEALAASGAAGVLDGPMFSICDGREYATSRCSIVRFSQYEPSRGEAFGGESSTEGLTIAVIDGVATAADGARIPPDASAAVQLYPALVRAGRNVADNGSGSNGSAEWRAGLAILGDGRLAFAAGAMSMEAFARGLIAAGAVEAGYTDGGGSTSLWLEDGQRYGASEGRRVATWLLIEQESVLASLVPSTSAGWVMAAALLVAVGTAGYAAYERRHR